MSKIQNEEEIQEILPLEVPPDIILTVEEDEEEGLQVSSTTIPLTMREINNQKAKEAKDSRKLPPLPGYAPSIEQFEEWTKLLDENQWSHIAIYLYRVWPKIVRQLSDSDNKNYIDTLCKEHSDNGLIKYLRDTHGGGTYKIMVNDLDQKTARNDSKGIMQFSFRIDPTELEPKLDLREIDVTHKPNMGYVNKMVSKGLMDSKGNVMTPQQGGVNGNPAELAGAMGQMFEKFMAIYAAADKGKQAMIDKLLSDGNTKKDDGGIQTLLLEKLKQDNPSNQVDMLVKLMALMQPKHDEGGGMIALLIKQMNDSNERMMTMVNKMFEMKSEPKEDFFDKFIKYRTVAPEIFGSSGNERPTKRETAEIIVDGIKELGLPMLGVASQFLQAKGFNPVVPVTEQQAQEFVQHNPSQQQQNPIQHSKVLPMPSQQQPVEQSVCQKLIMQFGGILITKIKANVDGATLADELEGASPIIGPVYHKLKSEGAVEILKAMESIPEFWNETGKIYGRDHMIKLIEDFLMDPPDDEGDDDDEEERLPVNGKEEA